MSDRRRINGPSGGTTSLVFSKLLPKTLNKLQESPFRTRRPTALRKMFLKTGVTPSASGSAYLELQSRPSESIPFKSTISSLAASGLKLTCTVHGPRPLPRSAPFTPTIILTTQVKFAPFATRQRRGYARDATERDLTVHLETALRGVIIGDRWPKSGVEVMITILEAEEDRLLGDNLEDVQDPGFRGIGDWSMMSVLSGCITVASAAIADAGIDCVDMVAGGVAALAQTHHGRNENMKGPGEAPYSLVLDPVPSEHVEVIAACVVGYLPSRDEITDLWMKGSVEISGQGIASVGNASCEQLVDSAVQAALGAHRVLTAAIKEAAELERR